MRCSTGYQIRYTLLGTNLGSLTVNDAMYETRERVFYLWHGFNCAALRNAPKFLADSSGDRTYMVERQSLECVSFGSALRVGQSGDLGEKMSMMVLLR